MTAITKLFMPMLEAMGRSHQAMVCGTLKKYGLRYDDLLDPLFSKEIQSALDRCPQSEIDLRNQRIKRASDLSSKKQYLSPEMQAKQTPLAFYATPLLDQVKLENEERAALGTEKPYDRSIP
mmetsp:Transcript_33564/g.94968  ORF Transcript_33564/g.94968 Transcript_33564/m.94968 type:complete len:122 (+) Transcript_33564:130-495(+)|eukprot:CAMPEP_0117665464 /NCGR_PEP_ID=MMETSP0804-20121206/9825_1 /TAXON_ID=1074897 /ORGANISM="Tetraselmis astigmatica, Strain CCMP880" /LENGTH=121 /DNA_ID=CAMNT_0005472881 /DNA_START=88 /DNA_END=453 /DNA_ORIENTATION=-